MARFPLAFPPGVYRNGTDFQTSGRYADASLVRWYGSALGPVGGWRQWTATIATGIARACLPWKDNSGNSWFAVATESKLYVASILQVVSDITPAGFTVGHADASAAGGFGSGLFGTGFFGTPRPGTTQITDATQCSLDTFGQNLIFLSPNDGKLYKWTLNPASVATVNAAAPTGAGALVVTAEGFIFLLGTTDPRTLSWCDQRDDTVWTSSATNQAGNFTLQTQGRLMCGKNIQGATLLLTDQDAWTATYVPNNNVYSFKQKGVACGAISRQCMVGFNMQAAWMSPSGFWLYNGYVQPIPCDVLDYVQRDINMVQASKIFGTHISQYHEIEWRYCSASSSEIDRCVVWNYKDNTWNIGRANRTCGADRGAFQYPIMVDSTGKIYDHENGLNYGGAMPYATTGAITLGKGDNVMHVTGLYPDDITVGDVTATFLVKNNRDDAYVSFGPYICSSQTDLRFVGRQIEVTFTGANLADWRVGTPALDLEVGGGR